VSFKKKVGFASAVKRGVMTDVEKEMKDNSTAQCKPSEKHAQGWTAALDIANYDMYLL